MNVVGTGALLWCRCKRGKSGTVYDGWRDPECLWGFSEVLYDGAAGTSKTFSDCVRMHDICSRYPKARILLVRETRQSLRESVQPLYETQVIGLDHEILQHGGSREHRVSYDYWNGPRAPDGSKTKGAHIALGGVDRIELYLSTDWDLCVFHEATNPRISEYHWNTIATRMRGRGIPHPHCQYPDGIVTDGKYRGMSVEEVLTTTERFKERMARDPQTGRMRKIEDGQDDYGTPLFFRQRVAECNPSMVEGQNHWLMQRWLKSEGKVARITAVHGDNPAIDAEYLENLRSLPEPFRSVYFEGKWVSAHGKCWPSYDPKRHLVRGEFRRDASTGAAHIVVADWLDDNGFPKVFAVKSVTAGFDWGIGHAGSLQIGATTTCGKLFRIAEVHYHDQGIEWWAGKVAELVDLYRIEAILCDPSARAVYEFFNERLGHRAHGRKVGQICFPADNSKQTNGWVQGGIDLVRTMFAQDRLFLFSDCHYGPIDSKLRHKRMPIGLHEEILGYVLAADPHNPDRFLSLPDKKRGLDDGCDSLRYLCVDVFKLDRDLRSRFNGIQSHDPARLLTGAEEERLQASMNAGKPTKVLRY